MKITDIKRQAKRADRYSIYGGGRYIFSLSESELLNLGLKINQEISPAELEKLRVAAEEDKAYDRSLGLIMRRPRSEWEVREYLKRKDYKTPLIDTILNRLSIAGYIDDLDFARRWIESRRLLKSTSKRKLKLELRQKRLTDEIIKQALDADEGDEQEILRELITKKRGQSRYQNDQKLIAYLARQGFSYQDIKDTLKSF